MFSAKQGNYWYHFYNVFGMKQSLTGGLNPGPPALEASTLPLGYQGVGIFKVKFLKRAKEFKTVLVISNRSYNGFLVTGPTHPPVQVLSL